MSQLGIGTQAEESGVATPQLVSGFGSAIAVSAGYQHTLALKDDGTVWGWGANDSGQVGDGTMTAFRATPVQVNGLTDVVTICAGFFHSVALKRDGTVWAWGSNGNGTLGDATTTSSSVPVQVNGLADVVAVSANYFHVVALKRDGTVWAWGDNGNGVLGDGTILERHAPVQVVGLQNVISIATGTYHSVALKNDGTVWSWGGNYYGQLGDGTTTGRSTPAQVSGLGYVISIAAGDSHTMAVSSDGTVWGWGANSMYGQLGDGTASDHLLPTTIPQLNGSVSIAAGGAHTLAMKNDGTVWGCGWNRYGQLGDGTAASQLAPVAVTGIGNVIAVAAGQYRTTALLADKTVLTWGQSMLALLPPPVPVIGLDDVVAVAAGLTHDLAVRSDGTVRAWGDNWYGQLGDGTVTSRSVPVQVSELTDVSAVAGGKEFSLALKTDGTVWAWGDNCHSQHGDGTWSGCYTYPPAPSTPVQVVGPDNIVAIAAGGYHALALASNGTVWAWGANDYGQVGNGTQNFSVYPGQVSGLSDVVAIAAGINNSVALKSDGTVWAWGANYLGQVGDGTKTSRPSPTQVAGLSDIIRITAGSFHTIAMSRDGNAWTWGSNVFGQLGDGSMNDRLVPIPVSGLEGSSSFSGGYFHSVALQGDGSIMVWGDNGFGQLGIAVDPTPRASPLNLDASPPEVVISGLHASANPTTTTVKVTATDNFAVAGYYLSEDPSPPMAAAAGWSVTTPTSFSFGDIGNRTLYAWAKDQAGNISPAAAVSVTLPLVSPLALTITGGGSVQSTPAQTVVCSSGTCNYAIPEGTRLTLGAIPQPDSFFAGWSGACTGTGSCTLDMTTARTVTATFSPILHDGDFDGDGVTITDALKTLRIAVGLMEPSVAEKIHGDVSPLSSGKPTGDGQVDISDALAILRRAVNLDNW